MQVLKGKRITCVKAQGFIKFEGGLGESAQIKQREAEIIMGAGAIGHQAFGDGILGHCFAEPVGHKKCVAQAKVCIAIIGLELDGGRKMPNGLRGAVGLEVLICLLYTSRCV